MNASAVALWGLSWQTPSAGVGIVAAVVSLVVVATAATWRVAAARLVAVLLIVLMLSGGTGAPPLPPSSPSARTPIAGPRLVDFALPRVARVGESVAIEAVAWLPAMGPGERQTPLLVELVDERGAVLVDAPLQPASSASDAAHHTYRASLSWCPKETGIARLTARLVEPETHAAIQGPAASLPAVCGVDADPLQVLLIDGAARWETRHLQQLLEATPAVEVALSRLGHDTGTLPTTRQAAASFDAVVLGTFDPRDLPSGTAEALAASAAADGLGVIWSLDGRSDLAPLAASPLADLLPCTPQATPPALPATQGFSVSGTPAAAGFRWLQPLLRAAERSQADVYLPALVRARRGSTLAPLVLAPHAASDPHDRSPAVLVDHSASGRVVALLAETWRWRAAGGGPDVDAFWRSAITAVAEPRRWQRMGAPLAEAARVAEQARQARRSQWETRSLQTDHEQAAWRQPVWNHPVLVAMVMLVLATGWLLANRDAQTNGSRET